MLIACYSEPQAEAITEIIDCAIGMNSPIRADAAMVFAASFYRALGFDESVASALEIAKAQVGLEGMPGVAAPRLMARAGVDPATIFPCRA